MTKQCSVLILFLDCFFYGIVNDFETKITSSISRDIYRVDFWTLLRAFFKDFVFRKTICIMGFTVKKHSKIYAH